MKIAIIGGGWVGCHLSYKLKNIHDVTIFEKNDELFTETSYNNQNRLHLGYHYPRSYKTRELCKTTFNKFISDYPFLINDVKPNIYCVSGDNSLVDFKTFIKIFDEYDFQILEHDNLNFNNLEGCINTEEKHIDFNLAYKFFNTELKKITQKKHITNLDLVTIKKDFDLIINCTNNHLTIQKSENHFYELTLTLLYEKISDKEFGSLTIMDGKFVSLYPYKENIYTLTDVEHTPIKIFNNIDSLLEFKNQIDYTFINEKKYFFEKKIKHYYESFNDEFRYHDFFLSTKTKIISNTDDRYPIILENDNVVSCFTGKIQGIYIIEDYIMGKICRMIN